MTVLGIMKRSRKAAKEPVEPQPDKQVEQPQTKYRHVPTHAAADALLGAPSGWNRDDASKIREHNRRRSAIQMAAQGNRSRPAASRSMLSPVHGSMVHSYSTGNLHGAGVGNSSSSSSSSSGAGIPNSASSVRGPAQWTRPSSRLSKVSFPAGLVNPVVHMSQSYKSMGATLQGDDSPSLAAASGSTSSRRASAMREPADNCSNPPKESSQTTSSLTVPPTPSASLPSSGQETKDSLIYDDTDVFEMKTFPSKSAEGSHDAVPNDAMPSVTLTGPDRSSLPCSHLPASRSRLSRIFRSNTAAVAV